ncbi:hypothetical protein, partial [Staphylococcus epidermidis]|uniref:hypothetical protein n=1 Tax=Staphylococcus epidermidis TaxID=1282 RepID=UPI0021B41E14
HNPPEKHTINMIYTIERILLDDALPIPYKPTHPNLKHPTYLLFDVQTTRLSNQYHKIIQLAPVKLHNREIIDNFQPFS